jgi:alpha-tubulin suppressor-like RCC1 family protein
MIFFGVLSLSNCSQDTPPGAAKSQPVSVDQAPTGDEFSAPGKEANDSVTDKTADSKDADASKKVIAATTELALTEGLSGVIKIEIPAALEADLELDWVIQEVVEGDGSADFTPASGKIAIKAGEIFVEVTVVSAKDDKLESPEGNEERHLFVARSDDGSYKTKTLIKLLDGEAPVALPPPVLFASLGGGGADHNCMIKGEAAFCAGSNGSGEIGDKTTTGRNRPTAVFGLTTKVTSIGVGQNHACAVMDGAAWCWGLGTSGQLGIGTNDNHATPQAVPTLAANILHMTAGFNFSCAATVAGAVSCFGGNGQGQLGVGSTAASDTPTPALIVTTGVTALAAGTAHICAIKTGALYCWGRNVEGELGLGTTGAVVSTPTLVPGLETLVTSVAAKGNTTCAIKDKALYCWGSNLEGQIAQGNVGGFFAIPKLVKDVGVTDVKVGVSHICGIFTGILNCWGGNASGQIGNNTKTRQLTPLPITGLDANILAIGLGETNTCVLGKTASHCWGRGQQGELGVGTNVDKLIPTAVVYP